jgi:nitroimidazol reductase NimA-like FMN-containing flavoprotein (pyridoxamine 5'-phosphate oxidase superfamily)
MHQSDAVEQLLTWDECWRHLRRHRTGRLAWGYGPSIDIAPTSYLADGQTLYIPTGVDTRTVMTGTSPWVAFEIDGLDDGQKWSVLVKGPTRKVTSLADREVIGDLRTRSLHPRLASSFVRLDPVSVTGWSSFAEL